MPFLPSRPQYNVDSMKFASALELAFDGEYILTAYSDDGRLCEGRGNTVAEAFSSASENCGGKLFYGTAEAIFLCLGTGASELADYAVSDTELRLSVPVVFCEYSEEAAAAAAQHGITLSALIEEVYTKSGVAD